MHFRRLWAEPGEWLHHWGGLAYLQYTDDTSGKLREGLSQSEVHPFLLWRDVRAENRLQQEWGLCGRRWFSNLGKSGPGFQLQDGCVPDEVPRYSCEYWQVIKSGTEWFSGRSGEEVKNLEMQQTLLRGKAFLNTWAQIGWLFTALVQDEVEGRSRQQGNLVAQLKEGLPVIWWLLTRAKSSDGVLVACSFSLFLSLLEWGPRSLLVVVCRTCY